MWEEKGEGVLGCSSTAPIPLVPSTHFHGAALQQHSLLLSQKCPMLWWQYGNWSSLSSS